MPPPDPSSEKRSLSGSGVPLGTQVDVYPSSPLPELNCAGGTAFAARLKNDATADFMAVICTGNLPPRLEYANGMKSITHPAILNLMDHVVVSWPDGVRYCGFAYQRPVAGRFKRSIDETHQPPGEDAINRHFVTPIIGVLNEFMRMGIFHGGIRPTNIFWRLGTTTPPQLGECLSAPAGIGQPVLFETIERGMSMPAGRGTGTHVDDCYAFGVTVAMLILGHNPLAGLSDAAIIQAKLERGTFNALIGNHRLSATHIELLRGLLTDDAHQRWTATDLDQWLGGRRLTPKGSDAGRRAARHFDFGGKEYWQVRPLAAALAANVSEAARAIDSGALEKWLRRSLGDEDMANDVDEARRSLKEGGKTVNYEDQIVARTCIALNPPAPIYFRGFSFMPGGIAAMLAEAMVTGTNLQLLSEIITSRLITFWVDMQKEMKTELVPIAQQFERISNVIEKTTYGNGIERAIYELNPLLPCLSPMLRTQYVTTPKGLLVALERVASSGLRGRDPMDRHIAAFLIVRDRRSELLLESMATPEGSARRGLAMMTLYSEMQNRHGPESLPNLAQWIAPALDPVVRRYFSRSLREALQKQVKEAAERGSITALTRLVDDPQRLERDEQEFVAARLLYLSILKEMNMLEGKIGNRDNIVHSAGRPIAATVSTFVAILVVISALVRAVLMSF